MKTVNRFHFRTIRSECCQVDFSFSGSCPPAWVTASWWPSAWVACAQWRADTAPQSSASLCCCCFCFSPGRRCIRTRSGYQGRRCSGKEGEREGMEDGSADGSKASPEVRPPLTLATLLPFSGLVFRRCLTMPKFTTTMQTFWKTVASCRRPSSTTALRSGVTPAQSCAEPWDQTPKRGRRKRSKSALELTDKIQIEWHYLDK